ncbi:MAG: HD domain-containing protein [Nitrospirota bacterium]|nr:HD domain-containing protein [Nitrospirota bacterium]
MNSTDTTYYRAWFADYCKTFYYDDPEHQRNIRLKEEHTELVRQNAVLVARGLGLGDDDVALAELAGLFHDVGRFPQYRDHKTFRDSDSVNHAALGAKVLVEQKVLEALPKDDRESIIRAVALHNVFTVPPGVDERALLFLRIVRDADKLDIWRVFIEYFIVNPDERPSAAGLGLPDDPTYSPHILEQLRQREMVRLDDLRTLNDFKLLQLAWIFDLNFAPSLRLLRERNIVGRLAGTLPSTAEISDAITSVNNYVRERSGETR